MHIPGIIMMSICLWMAAVHPATAQDRLSGGALVAKLRQGGYNIYFRHAATDWSTEDQVSGYGDWQSCDPQKMRQLSDQGRAVAQRIGESIRRLKIPIGRVYSSEYCRTRETAQYLGLGAVETTQAIMNMRAAAFVGGTDAVTERARHVLSVPPREGTNTVFVAHGNVMQAASGAYTAEGGAVIFAPEGEGSFRIVAILAPAEWDLLARDFEKAVP